MASLIELAFPEIEYPESDGQPAKLTFIFRNWQSYVGRKINELES